MALPQEKIRLYTEEEYLAFEREAEVRHEYIDGEIYEMAGESDEHGDISVNLVRELSAALRGKPCKVKVKDTKVRSGPMPIRKGRSKGLFSYPDIVVICGTPQHLDSHRDVVINPTVIVEVLSPTTEVFDRKEKFMRYQLWCPTLKDYILVSQDAPVIEHYVRMDDGSWNYKVFRGLENSFTIESINCTLNLADVYDRVAFPIDEDEQKIEDAKVQEQN